MKAHIRNMHVLKQRIKNFGTESAVEKKKRNIIIVGLATNTVYAVAKSGLGLAYGSPALLSDGVHSLSDAISDVVALASLNLAARQPDEKMPFGYGHFDTLGSLVLGISLMGAGAGAAYVAVNDLISIGAALEKPVNLVAENMRLIGFTMVGSIFVKEALFRYTLKLGKESRSPVIVASAYHHRSDSLSTFFAGFGILGSAYGYPMLDPLAALIVSAWVFRSGSDVAWDAIGDLTDRQSSYDHQEVVNKIKQVTERLAANTEIVSAHDIRLRRMGSIRIVDMHAVVDPTLSVTASYQAGERLRRTIMEEIPEISNVFVHVDAGVDAFVDASTGHHGNDTNLEVKLPMSQYQMEAEVRRIVANVRRTSEPYLLGISHINVHYIAQGNNQPVKSVVEVNLLIDPAKYEQIRMSQVEKTGENVRRALLAQISDIDSVDLHVQLSSGADDLNK